MPGEEGKTERRPRGSDSGPHLVRRRPTEGCPRRWVVAGNGERRRRAAARGRGGEVLGRRERSEGRLAGRFIGREGEGRWPAWEGHRQHRSLAINGGRDARGQGASCEGEGMGRRRTSAVAGRTPAWRARAASTQWHSEQQWPWRDAGGAMRVRVHACLFK
jgi:hypothetical protein